MCIYGIVIVICCTVAKISTRLLIYTITKYTVVHILISFILDNTHIVYRTECTVHTLYCIFDSIALVLQPTIRPFQFQLRPISLYPIQFTTTTRHPIASQSACVLFKDILLYAKINTSIHICQSNKKKTFIMQHIEIFVRSMYFIIHRQYCLHDTTFLDMKVPTYTMYVCYICAKLLSIIIFIFFFLSLCIHSIYTHQLYVYTEFYPAFYLKCPSFLKDLLSKKYIHM